MKEIPSPNTADSKECLILKAENIAHCMRCGELPGAQQEEAALFDAVAKAVLPADAFAPLLQWVNALYGKALQSAGVPFSLWWNTYLGFCRRVPACKSRTAFCQCHSQMLQAYCALLRDTHPPYSSMTRRILQYIQRNLSSRLDLQTLADHMGFSPTYISHRFKKEMGIAPMQYITRKRMQTAAHLLRTTDSTIQEIANAVGFTDLSYFAKLFHQATGQSPSQYRTAAFDPN